MIALLFSSFYLAQHGALALESLAFTNWLAASFKWLLIFTLATANSILLIGMGALAHDAVHKVLFRSGGWNELWGGILSAFILTPFYANRQFHLTHHSYAHQPGLDPENEMHDRPFLHALTIGSFIGLYAQYRNFFHNVVHMTDRRLTSRALKDAFFLVTVGALYFALLPALDISLWYTVVPMLLMFPMVFSWRALADHYGIPGVVRGSKKQEQILEANADNWPRDQERLRLEVSGWVVLTHPWLEWLWSHVNYHEVHHKYPYLSHRYLKDIFEATRATNPYLVVNGYWRSLLNVRNKKYYTTQAEILPFLSTAKH